MNMKYNMMGGSSTHSLPLSEEDEKRTAEEDMAGKGGDGSKERLLVLL